MMKSTALPLEICLTHTLIKYSHKGKISWVSSFPSLLVSIPHQIDTLSVEYERKAEFNLFRFIFYTCFSRYCPQGYSRGLLVDSFLLYLLEWTGSELHSGFVMNCLHLGCHHLSMCQSITFSVEYLFLWWTDIQFVKTISLRCTLLVDIE